MERRSKRARRRNRGRRRSDTQWWLVRATREAGEAIRRTAVSARRAAEAFKRMVKAAIGVKTGKE